LPIENSPYKIRNNYNRNSNEISSVFNKFSNQNISTDNSSNNYSYGNNPNINTDNILMNRNNFNINMEIKQHNSIYNRKNYQSMPINYPNNRNINSMNNMNNSLNGSKVINFNGVNYNVGSKINNNKNHHNIFENQFRRSNYSYRTENLNIGNNVFNINLSSVTSQDIFKSYEVQKNKMKKKQNY